jgi:YD repeat-containing protein
MMPKILFLSLLLLGVLTGLRSQDLKPLDYQNQFKKQKITSCTITQVRQKNNAKDSVVIGRFVLNASGQMISSIEYSPLGKPIATQFFSYDSKGKLMQCEIEFAEEIGVRHAFHLEYDAKGKVIRRTLPTEHQHYWYKEEYTYNAAGVMTKSVQHYKNQGQDVAIAQSYPEVASPKENHSLNFMFDQRGLLVLRQFYNEQNKILKSHIYEYK